MLARGAGVSLRRRFMCEKFPLSSIAHAPASAPGFSMDRAFATAAFAAAVVVGLVGAFIGLDSYGFWFDELFTARVLEPAAGSGDLWARIATDVHPPVYPTLLFLYAKLAGTGDAALRSFSALAAVGAVLVFIASTRTVFSLSGRLFGAAMATASLFWFFQSQNARSYALCLVFSAAILAQGLAWAEGRREVRARGLAVLFAVMLVGSFVHFYVMYEALAVLIVLALLRRRERYVFVAMAVALAAASMLYVRLVMVPFAQASLGDNWYPNYPAWYLAVLKSCWQYTFGTAGGLALALCGAIALMPGRSAPGLPKSFGGPRLALLVGVPVLVLLGAIVSSTVLAPNFFDRNYLVLSPFFWALASSLYDGAVERADYKRRAALNVALSLIVIAMAAVVMQRAPSERPSVLYEPFRESAQWVGSQPACRGQAIPIITTDRKSWYRPGFAQDLYASIYGRYLHGFTEPRLLFMEDLAAHRIDADLAEELRRRVDGQGCSVLAWSVHNMTAGTLAKARVDLLQAIDRSGAGARLRIQEFHQGATGYAIYVAAQGGR